MYTYVNPGFRFKMFRIIADDFESNFGGAVNVFKFMCTVKYLMFFD